MHQGSGAEGVGGAPPGVWGRRFQASRAVGVERPDARPGWLARRSREEYPVLYILLVQELQELGTVVQYSTVAIYQHRSKTKQGA